MKTGPTHGPTKKGEATRARIIDAVIRQAAVRGLTAVSLADVAEAVGLSKSGIFKHFDSKEDMHAALVESVMTHFTEVIWRPAEAYPPGRPRLEVVFDRWLHWGETQWAESGCPVNALSMELDDQPGPLRDLLRTRLQVFRAHVIEEFRRLRDPPLSEDEAKAAYFQMKSFLLGHGDARRMMGDTDAGRSAAAAFRALLDRESRAAA